MKSKTHVYMANLLIRDLTNSRSITFPGGIGTYEVPEEISNAILKNPDAFRAGSTGPDFYPDMQVGQTIIHPKMSGEWLELMFKEFGKLSSDDPEREQTLAFILGFMMHYSADLYGHDYVNRWAFGWFPDVKEAMQHPEKMLKIVRHVLVESYMDEKVPKDPAIQPTSLAFPPRFMKNCFLSDAALERYPSETALKYAEEMRRYAWRKSQNSTTNMIDLVNYYKSWEVDLTVGIDNWLKTWHDVTCDMTSNDQNVIDAKEALRNWLRTYFVKMTPAPDFIADVMNFIASLDILKPVEEIIIREAKELLNAFVKAATGVDVQDALESIKQMLKNPGLYLNNGILYDGHDITMRLDEEFGNFGSELDTSKQSFHAFQQSLDMGKLCLLGPDNLNAIVAQFAVDKTPYFKKTDCTNMLEKLFIKIRTHSNSFWGGEFMNGTDDNVYLGVVLHDNEVIEILMDEPMQNDFEAGDEHTYSFLLPRKIQYSHVRGFRLRKDYITFDDDWKPEYMIITDQSGNQILNTVIDRKMVGRSEMIFGANITGFTKHTQLNLDPRIISFLFSLDGVGKFNDLNPTDYKQWTDEDNLFYKDEGLRKDVHEVLFKTNAFVYDYVPRPFTLK